MNELPDYKNKPFEKGYLGKFDDKAQEYELLFDEKSRIVARFKDGKIQDFDGHRIQVDIGIKTYNYLKQSELSGDEIRRGGTGTIRLNNFQVMEFFFRDPLEALISARRILQKLFDHPIQIWRPEEREKIKGRLVFYHDYPCRIKYAIWDQGCVILETEDGKPFPKHAWQNEDEYEKESTAKVEIFDRSIWWYRK